MALEAEFWQALTQLAAARTQSLSALVADTDARRDTSRPLASALRVLALRELPRLVNGAPRASQDKEQPSP